MKITDILIESKQLDEGPILDKIGKGVDTVARGIGAVPGVAVGAGQAIAKGYRAGKAAVAGIDRKDTPLPAPNRGDYGQLSKDKNKIWNKTSQQWEPYDQTTSNAPQQSVAPPNAPQQAVAPKRNIADFGTIQRSIRTLTPKQKNALINQLSGNMSRRRSTPEEINADRKRIMNTI